MKVVILIVFGLFGGLGHAKKYVKKIPANPSLVEGIGNSRAAALRAAIQKIPAGYERDLSRDLKYKCLSKNQGRCSAYSYTIHVAKKQ